MQWQSMKTAPRDGTLVWVTLCSREHRWIAQRRHPYFLYAIAWAPIDEPTPYTGTLDELDAEGGDA